MFDQASEKTKKLEENARDCSILFLTEKSKYQEALALINLTQFDKTPEILIATAACYVGLNKNYKALEILCHAEKKGWILPDVLSMKGRILFRMNEFEQARAAFEQYEQIYSQSKDISLWILRCNAHITLEQDPLRAHFVKIEKPQMSAGVGSDWYQSTTTISMTLFIAHLTEDQVNVVFKEKSVDVTVNSSSTHFHQTFHLLKEIVPKESKIEYTPCKIELKMKKAATGNWKTLESKS